MKVIALVNSGLMALVDDEDYIYLNRFKWSLDSEGNYAIRGFNGKGGRGVIRMHELVVQGEAGKEIHHKNGDLLDCQKENLVAITRAFINHRTRKNRGITSDYCGVCWNKQNQKWAAYISKDKKRYHIGYFTDEKKAARAYNQMSKELYGDLAILNVEE
jgi:hypothetical protein